MTVTRVGTPDDPREGRRIARLFRQYRALGEVRPCDLDSILADDQLELIPSRISNCGYAACLMREPGGRGGGIWLQPGQDEGRKRFSIAHELGHYHIPAHAKSRPDPFHYCADGDLRARSSDARREEWEANDFATELLMPMKLFRADTMRRDISIATAQVLAAPDMYGVSVTAAAWRIIQATHEPAAMVVSTNGIVDWIVRSESFLLPLTERQQRLHPDTLAASVFRREGAEARPQSVPFGAWLDRPMQVTGQLLESTHSIPRFDQVVSLLWLIDEEDDEEPQGD